MTRPMIKSWHGLTPAEKWDFLNDQDHNGLPDDPARFLWESTNFADQDHVERPWFVEEGTEEEPAYNEGLKHSEIALNMTGIETINGNVVRVDYGLLSVPTKEEGDMSMGPKKLTVVDLDSNNRLRRIDKLNWTIERRTPKGWVIQGYFPKLEQAANYLLTMGIGEAESIKDLKACVEMARDAVLIHVTRCLHDLKEK